MKRHRAEMGRALAVLMALLAAFAASIAATGVAHALDPSERLPDAKLESRARELSAELRCLVCQNQSIDDSDAPLAKDLRRLVRERILAGETDTQVKSFLVDRYGDFVLLKPPFNTHTLLLWSTPLLVLGLIGFFLWRAMSNASQSTPASARAPLSEAEEQRLKALLDSGDGERRA